MTHCALLSGKYKSFLFNEINPLVVELIKKAINGDYNYDKFKPKFITRKDFFEFKEKDGYIKYIWSFGNNGKSYLYGKNNESLKNSLHDFVVFKIKNDFIKENFNDIEEYIPNSIDDIHERRMLLSKYFKFKKIYSGGLEPLERLERLDLQQNLLNFERLQQLENLQPLKRLEFSSKSYEEYVYEEGDIVYCDPPYENTQKYSSEGFDSKKFYNWVATRNYPVYFSSYDNVNDERLKIIYMTVKKVTLCATNNSLKKNECLYWNGK